MFNEKNYSKLSLEELVLQEKNTKTTQTYGKAVCIVVPILTLLMYLYNPSNTALSGMFFAIGLGLFSLYLSENELKNIQKEIQNKSQ
jgi:hypothetical protein